MISRWRGIPLNHDLYSGYQKIRGTPVSDVWTEQAVRERLHRITQIYGRLPPLSEILSSRHDGFIPYSGLMKNIFFQPKHLSRKTAELAAISAATAIGGEHHLEVHIG